MFMKLNKKNLCIGLLVVMILVVGVLGGCSQANDRNLKGATEVGGVEETQDGVMKEKVGGDVEVVEKNEEGESNKKIDLGWGYEKDNDFVFYANKKIEGADLETFEPLESFIVGAMYDTYIFKDKHSVYLRGHKISYADPDTFEVLGGGYSKDGVSVYYITEKVEGADSKTLELIYYPGPGYETVDYAKDKNHVYFKGEIKPELDASTFEF